MRKNTLERMLEASIAPTFKNFLIFESDIESEAGNSMDDMMDPSDQADDLSFADPNPEADAQPIDLDSDERFLDLSPAEQARLRVFARNMSPTEVEDQLQSTWERVSGSSNMMGGLDDMEDGEVETSSGEEFEVADSVTATQKPVAPMNTVDMPMRESFLASLLK